MLFTEGQELFSIVTLEMWRNEKRNNHLKHLVGRSDPLESNHFYLGMLLLSTMGFSQALLSMIFKTCLLLSILSKSNTLKMNFMGCMSGRGREVPVKRYADHKIPAIHCLELKNTFILALLYTPKEHACIPRESFDIGICEVYTPKQFHYCLGIFSTL